ncbi:MAG: FtsW/RodA/SpoVE family cell cycle protein, partial [Dehalococcoidia bacterium]|nr:FtsW/RodA/SpoVE family cell cycle protein [Dehalococcoidia bacterium]
VFAVLGEELGLVGTASVLLLLLLLMMLGYQAARRARDQFGLLVATGITTWLTAQALINIGGIVRLIPLTGVPLPFLSYGGSALAAELLALGVLVNISRFGRDRGGYLDREHAPTARRQVIRRRTG